MKSDLKTTMKHLDKTKLEEEHWNETILELEKNNKNIQWCKKEENKALSIKGQGCAIHEDW